MPASPSKSALPLTVHADGWQIRGCPVNGPALAARDGRVAVAWYTYAQSTHRVRAAFSTDGGRSFGPPVEIDAPRGGRSPVGRVSIALDDDGTAIVGWIASSREDASILLRRARPDGAVGAELRVGGTGAGRDAGFPRLVRTGNELVVAWTAPGETSGVRAARLPLAGVARAASMLPTVPEVSAVSPGAPAPDAGFTTLAGGDATLASLRGRVVLVNLWATWCEPCRHELPELAALHERDEGRGLVVGGTMGAVRTAPCDPIFWMHHANCDRLWHLWQQANPGAGTGLTGAAAVMDPWTETDADVASVTALGYVYQ